MRSNIAYQVLCFVLFLFWGEYGHRYMEKDCGMGTAVSFIKGYFILHILKKWPRSEKRIDNHDFTMQPLTSAFCSLDLGSF